MWSDGSRNGKGSTVAAGMAMNVLSANAGHEFREVLVEPFFETNGKSNKAQNTKLTYPKGVSLYPNPSRGLVFVKGFSGEELTAEVYNAIGIKIKQLNLSTTAGVIDLTGQPAGMYNITLRDVKGVKILHERIALAR